MQKGESFQIEMEGIWASDLEGALKERGLRADCETDSQGTGRMAVSLISRTVGREAG